MLYLTRKIGESVIINDNIEVTVVDIRGKSIKLGFTFPPEATVLRRELYERIQAGEQSCRSRGWWRGTHGRPRWPDAAGQGLERLSLS